MMRTLAAIRNNDAYMIYDMKSYRLYVSLNEFVKNAYIRRIPF